jgi:hypothetical protein
LRSRCLAHGVTRYNTDAVTNALSLEESAFAATQTRRKGIESILMAGEASIGICEDEYMHYNLRSLITKFKHTRTHHDKHFDIHTTAVLRPRFPAAASIVSATEATATPVTSSKVVSLHDTKPASWVPRAARAVAANGSSTLSRNQQFMSLNVGSSFAEDESPVLDVLN